jgi:hypothetical protein
MSGLGTAQARLNHTARRQQVCGARRQQVCGEIQFARAGSIHCRPSRRTEGARELMGGGLGVLFNGHEP